MICSGLLNFLYSTFKRMLAAYLYFLAHLSHWLMVSYYDRWMPVVRRGSSVVGRPSWVVRRVSSSVASKNIPS